MAKPEPSEWGRLNAGQSWCVVALDLDRAISRANFNHYEDALLQAIRERSWYSQTRRKSPGRSNRWPDPNPVPWQPKAIARAIRLPDNHLSTAKVSLVESLVLVETEGGLLINKNAEQWIFPPTKPGRKPGKRDGEFRLDDNALAYAKEAWPSPAEAAMDAETTPHQWSENSTGTESATPHQWSENSTGTERKLHTNGVKTPQVRSRPYKERARGNPTGLNKEESSNDDDTPTRDTNGTVGVGGKRRMAIKGLPALVELARELWPDSKPDFSEVIQDRGMDLGWTFGDRFDCVAAAMREAARSTRPIKNLFGYIVSVGKSIRDTGQPPELVAVTPKANADMAVSPADARRQAQRAKLMAKHRAVNGGDPNGDQ